VTTAFVMSGGASLGAIQVGMLQALVAHGVRPDLIVGTSVGALNGAWLAGAKDEDLSRLADLWRGLTRSTVFPANPLTGLRGFAGQGDHLVSGHAIRRLIAQNLRFDRMEDARIPLHVVATDVLTGEDVRLSTGPAIDAISASAAIPGLLPPVQVDGRPLMDGGTVNNTPITHAVELGADTVWVLTTGSACALVEPPHSALGMALHGLTLAINNRMVLDIERFQGSIDLRVAPPLCPLTVSPADFGKAGELIGRAARQTADWLAEGPVGVEGAKVLEPHGH
jgi:NTE family protein